MNRDTARTQIGFMGCHGALNGLRVANALQLSNQNDSASSLTLLCAAEICSIHFHYGWQPESLLANSLFADGAGALVLGGGSYSKSFQLLPKPRSWSLKSSVSHVVPNSLEAMSWNICDNGFSMTLSSSAPELIKLHLHQFLNDWLQSLNLRREDISAWAIHPGGARILDAVGQTLSLTDIDLKFSRHVLQQYGNMSSPTVLFVLDEIRDQLGCVPTVVLAFGPGLTIEAAYLACE